MSLQTFLNLTPDRIFAAVEKAGFVPTGEFSQLNSYENRVFMINLEDRDPVVAKFYRPGRWGEKTLLEEHNFLKELSEDGITPAAPLILKNDSTLIYHDDLWVTFFPRIRGRLPDELMEKDLASVGRKLAQLHMVGRREPAKHRPILDTNGNGGWDTLDKLEPDIAPEVRSRYVTAAEDILFAFEDTVITSSYQRIHGDCHRGNLIDDGTQFCFIDLDDFSMGPIIQDVWMLLSGDPEDMDREKEAFLTGYEEFLEFPHQQWDWIPLLRGLRIISYAGWIQARWSDPSFPRIFPDFNTYRYWAEETEALEKIARSINLESF
ncbi:MAG: serine/threonine protein kinase [Bdellovibrionota bacterium]